MPVDAQIDDFGHTDGLQQRAPLLRFDARQSQKIAHQFVEPFCLFVDRLQKLDAHLEVFQGPVEQRLDAGFDRSQRGL